MTEEKLTFRQFRKKLAKLEKEENKKLWNEIRRYEKNAKG